MRGYRNQAGQTCYAYFQPDGHGGFTRYAYCAANAVPMVLAPVFRVFIAKGKGRYRDALPGRATARRQSRRSPLRVRRQEKEASLARYFMKQLPWSQTGAAARQAGRGRTFVVGNESFLALPRLETPLSADTAPAISSSYRYIMLAASPSSITCPSCKRTARSPKLQDLLRAV